MTPGHGFLKPPGTAGNSKGLLDTGLVNQVGHPGNWKTGQTLKVEISVLLLALPRQSKTHTPELQFWHLGDFKILKTGFQNSKVTSETAEW
jgi:hypothetical protein